MDPDQFVEIVGNLYKDNKFVGSLFNGLSEEGVVSWHARPVRSFLQIHLVLTLVVVDPLQPVQFVIQMGMSAMNSDPAMDSGLARCPKTYSYRDE